jgi:hypothetical protein
VEKIMAGSASDGLDPNLAAPWLAVMWLCPFKTS